MGKQYQNSRNKQLLCETIAEDWDSLQVGKSCHDNGYKFSDVTQGP